LAGCLAPGVSDAAKHPFSATRGSADGSLGDVRLGDLRRCAVARL